MFLPGCRFRECITAAASRFSSHRSRGVAAHSSDARGCLAACGHFAARTVRGRPWRQWPRWRSPWPGGPGDAVYNPSSLFFLVFPDPTRPRSSAATRQISVEVTTSCSGSARIFSRNSSRGAHICPPWAWDRASQPSGKGPERMSSRYGRTFRNKYGNDRDHRGAVEQFHQRRDPLRRRSLFPRAGLGRHIGTLDSITVLGAGASTVQVGLRADRAPPLPDTRGR